MNRPLVIDAHVHIGTGDGLRGPWDTEGSLPVYLSRARPAGIRGAVIMAPLTSDYPRANAEIARIIAARPGLPRLPVRQHPHRVRPGRRTGRGGGARGLLRHQGARPRRPDHPRGSRGRPSLGAAGALRPGRRHRDGRDGRPRLSRRRLGGAAPLVLRRRLEGAVRLRRPAGPAPQRLHRHLGGALLRPPGGRRAAGRLAQGAVRQRRARSSTRPSSWPRPERCRSTATDWATCSPATCCGSPLPRGDASGGDAVSGWHRGGHGHEQRSTGAT